MATTNDKLILELKKEVEEKKALLLKSVKFNPITNASLELDGVKYNLHAAMENTCLVLLAKLGALRLGLKEVLPDEILYVNNFPVNDWITDLTSRFNILNATNEREKLKTLETRLNELLSTDKKVELELEQLTKDIRK